MRHVVVLISLGDSQIPIEDSIAQNVVRRQPCEMLLDPIVADNNLPTVPGKHRNVLDIEGLTSCDTRHRVQSKH